MAGSSAGLHEDPEVLSKEAVDRHRALVSIMEELEAVDWYDQRAEATHDPDLAGILEHNRDEEKEHAAMTLEWLRRNDAKWDAVLRTYLFTSESVLEVEEETEHGGGEDAGDDGSLGIGSLLGAAS
jgi:ferritin-like protein